MAVVFSENPEKDLWRDLLQFSYKANIIRYWSKKDLTSDENTINCIVGSFLQAFEYYNSAKDANIQIAPLLLYYGSTNLLYGMVNLLSGSIKRIDNHGMKLFIPDHMSFIADADIRFLSPMNGGVHVIANSIGLKHDLTKLGDWKLNEFLDSVAEINSDFIQCYGVNTGRIVMLDTYSTPDGKVEKVYYEQDNKDDLLALMSDVEGFSNSYLRISTAREYETDKEYFVLRHKLNGKDISDLSYSGQPYLRAGHRKNGQLVTLPTLLNMYISLFALASLCRYHPERWSPFVLNDTTGEKLLIEKFLFFARRMIPNYVLSSIVGEQAVYTYSRYSDKNTIKLVGEHQVQEMVDHKVRDYLDKQQVFQTVKR